MKNTTIMLTWLSAFSCKNHWKIRQIKLTCDISCYYSLKRFTQMWNGIVTRLFVLPSIRIKSAYLPLLSIIVQLINYVHWCISVQSVFVHQRESNNNKFSSGHYQTWWICLHKYSNIPVPPVSWAMNRRQRERDCVRKNDMNMARSQLIPSTFIQPR